MRKTSQIPWKNIHMQNLAKAEKKTFTWKNPLSIYSHVRQKYISFYLFAHFHCMQNEFDISLVAVGMLQITEGCAVTGLVWNNAFSEAEVLYLPRISPTRKNKWQSQTTGVWPTKKSPNTQRKTACSKATNHRNTGSPFVAAATSNNENISSQRNLRRR